MTSTGPTMDEIGLGRLSTRLSRLLTGGVIVSSVLLVLGLLAVIAAGGYQTANVITVWGGVGASWTSIGGNAEILLLVALFALVAVPLSRVIVSCVTFAQVGDVRFARLTALVLVIVLAAALIGWRLGVAA